MNAKADLAALYEQDFYAWSQRASELLRKGCFAEADIEHVAEEIEDIGIERKHSLKSQTRRLLVHLLKWQFQPERRSHSWLVSIGNARVEISDNLEENPSLKATTPDLPRELYQKAVKLAILETGLLRKSFPDSCPYTFDQMIDDDFLPGDE
ncbi:MAG TPA: DUF29 domain-containing protein [Bryobacteraceae bacterium]